MPSMLYGHPFSSFTEKVLVALHETDVPFTFRRFGSDDPAAAEEWEALSPMKRFPLLVDEGRVLIETSIIIEYAQTRWPGPLRLIPEAPQAALEVRLMDRMFDSYVMTPMLTLAFNASRPADQRDDLGAKQACVALLRAYEWLDRVLDGRAWAAGDDFSMADCAASPALLFAHWAHPIPAGLARLSDYRKRLMARPAFAKVIEEARPFRPAFPLGAPAED